MSPLISVVVPVYNVEKYIHKSITSILDQSFLDLEIIIVDDGSEDRSMEICEKLKLQDKRIKIISKSNGGVSSARNIGLDASTGLYISFIDPDDWIQPEMYKSMFDKIAETNAQAAMCNITTENGSYISKSIIPTNQNALNKNEIIEIIIKNMVSSYKDSNLIKNTIMGSACRFLFSKEVIHKNNLKFNEGIPFMEDLLFVVEYLLSIENLAVLEQGYYHYVIRRNSAVTTYRENLVNNNLKVFNLLKEIFTIKEVYSKVARRMDKRFIDLYLTAIYHELKRENPKNFLDKIKYVFVLMKDEKLNKTIKLFKFKSFDYKQKVLIILIRVLSILKI